MSNNLGVMQGRLLPKYKGRYQAHPCGYWEEEFKLASSFNLKHIEFILDHDDYELNPLMTISGLDKIRSISSETGVTVKTICADYFMDAPLHSKDESVCSNSSNVLINLIENASKIGVTDIVLPCVDQSSLKTGREINLFINNVSHILDKTSDFDINLSLETDLPPEKFLKLIEKFNSNRIKVNYDIGNSASLGFDPVEELQAYGSYISDIHIKDRLLNGGPVILGKGAADFDVFFKTIHEINYEGPFIMQAFRDDEGLLVFKKQLNWIKPFLES
jgi:L-ribulose-5-phosphate 3-epimerase